MKNITLNQITLVCVDCIDLNRAQSVINICNKYITFGDIKLLSSIKSENSILINHINNIQDYSKFILCELNNYINTEFVLLIQHDGYILNPFAWTDNFLKYDYIGATWFYKDKYNVGNGGFSLRSKKFLEKIQHTTLTKYHPEDHVICRIYGKHFKDNGITFAPEEIANKFSIEGKPYSGQFGFHGFHTKNRINIIED